MNNYNYDWYYMNRNNNYLYNMNNSEGNLFKPKEGFEKGNMFSNLYSGYKNYESMILMPKSEQEKMLLEIQEICFAAHDLNLYLDTNPSDQSMLMLFQDYLKKEKDLIKAYESKYGPMTVSNSINSNSFKWLNNWPWEVNNV